ncbi:MAG: nodulation protein, partial [Candidatus Electrothrix sp. AW5]|nr:nodulation protein [Candidatus Electrothrix gigas]
MTNSPIYAGIFEGHLDPAVALVCEGEVIAYAEEERFVRYKHAPFMYPIRSLRYCLEQTGIKPDNIEAIGINWNLPAYSDERMKSFFAGMGEVFPPDPNTRRWQQHVLGYFNEENTQKRHEMNWRRAFGTTVPPLHAIPHHLVHALQSYYQSKFTEALCVTIDGSGDQHCTVLWHCQGDSIRSVREICMPHSLGWFYAAFTEYLGFKAYDGEYKVMGLAAYGSPDDKLNKKISEILFPADDGIEYRVDPKYLHYGVHTWSDRFTDSLVELFGHPARLPGEPITAWHRNLAYAVQQKFEETVCRLVHWGMNEFGERNLCVGGGCGLNVKMNSKLFSLDCVNDLFAHPLCSDGGAAAGAALGACWQLSGKRPEYIRSLALGPEETDEAIQAVLESCHISYIKVDNIAEAVADELVEGCIVGWFQGRMEAGPRALGQRSILADPRKIEMRDRINKTVKFREHWRPFCPSMPAENAYKYLQSYTDAPFMNIAFQATEMLTEKAPGIVHIDGTVRV